MNSDTAHIDPNAIKDMKRLRNLTYVPYSRNSEWHLKPELYAYEFARQNCRAFVGYSESLYDVLTYSKNSCANQSCLTAQSINIKHIILDDNPQSINLSTQIGWVDALAIDSRAKGQKLINAKSFITFLISQNAYYAALVPGNGDAPRYLLPAYKHFYFDKNITKTAPLYDKLFPLAIAIKPIASEGLGFNLRDVGARFDTVILK